MGATLLEARELTVAWGGIRALDTVSLHVGAGEIVGLIGPNGAGKTTLINALTGYVRPEHGSIRLAGRDITGVSSRRRARAGIVRTFQDVRMFAGLTVEESVRACAEVGRTRRSTARRRTDELLSTFDLSERRRHLCESLSYGDQRRLAIARALATGPRVLLLDEPAAGLNDAETEVLGREILRIPEVHDCGVLLIEHNIALVTAVCTRLYVLDHGAEVFAGPSGEAFDDPHVRDAYLGHGFSARPQPDGGGSA